MNDKEGMFKSGKSIARNSSAPLFRGKENKGFSKVVESINRINRATELLEPGWHGSVRLSPYRQQEGTTCFFSGAIVVARDFFGVDIPETPLAAKARRLGLLNEAGARTAEEDKRSALEKFVKNETGVTIKFRGHSWGNREEDLQILDVLVQRGNLASVLYPLTDNSHEWETFFGEIGRASCRERV